MKRFGRIIVILSAAYLLPCMVSTRASAALTRFVSVPILRALGVCSARISFPAAGLLLTGLCLLALAVRRCRRAIPLLLTMFWLLVWIPPQRTRLVPAFPAPSQEAVTRLCESLAGQLNRTGRQEASLASILTSAQAAMNSPFPPKAARYPEWMRLLRLSGLYLPLTGEAMVDPTRSAASLPFTAAHELVHARAVADECAANILAYEACVAYGGVPAYSARLWALKYAAGYLENARWILHALAPDIAADFAAIPYDATVGGRYAALTEYLCQAGAYLGA